jgi:hypothetical protein
MVYICTIRVGDLFNELYLNYEDGIDAQILTVNAAGFSTPSQGHGAVMPRKADVPEPPTNVRLVERSSGSVTIEWTAPTNDGGAYIEWYVVYFKTEDDEEWQYTYIPQYDGEDTTVTLENLENGKVY